MLLKGGIEMAAETERAADIRVLIADDHALVREGTRRLLEESEGIQVVGEAADGEQAAEMVAELKPDVVLLDVAMPKLNGVEATKRIKAIAPSTAILILTAYDDDIYVMTLLESGAAGYLLKDVHANDLVSAVRAVQAGEPVLSPVVVRKMMGHLAAQQQQPGGHVHEPEQLTGQERLVLQLAARGLSNKAIALEMSLSPRTIQAHLAHIFNKLGVASRTEAVVTSMKQGWLRADDIE